MVSISHTMEEEYGQYFDSVIPFEVSQSRVLLNSSVVGCFRKLGVVGCVPYGTQGFLSSLGESSGLFLNKMDRVLSDVSLDTKMEVRYVQYD